MPALRLCFLRAVQTAVNRGRTNVEPAGLLTKPESGTILTVDRSPRPVAMRYFLPQIVLIVVLGTAVPAQAQMRNQVESSQPAPAQLYDSNVPSFTLNNLFSPEHFTMGHSYEMSFGSFGGGSESLGMYTNTMLFQFSRQLDARVDVSVAHSFTGNQFGNEGQGGQVFIRNAQVNYRPTENMQFHISFRQSPFGMYGHPYGHRGGYGYAPFQELPPVGR